MFLWHFNGNVNYLAWATATTNFESTLINASTPRAMRVFSVQSSRVVILLVLNRSY
jgi:hypothetical protein